MNSHFLSKMTLCVPTNWQPEARGTRLVTAAICGHIKKKKISRSACTVVVSKGLITA